MFMGIREFKTESWRIIVQASFQMSHLNLKRVHWLILQDCNLYSNNHFGFRLCPKRVPKRVCTILRKARSRRDETRNGHRGFRYPFWCSSQVSFRRAHLKRDKNFDYRGFRFPLMTISSFIFPGTGCGILSISVKPCDLGLYASRPPLSPPNVHESQNRLNLEVGLTKWSVSNLYWKCSLTYLKHGLELINLSPGKSLQTSRTSRLAWKIRPKIRTQNVKVVTRKGHMSGGSMIVTLLNTALIVVKSVVPKLKHKSLWNYSARHVTSVLSARSTGCPVCHFPRCSALNNWFWGPYQRKVSMTGFGTRNWRHFVCNK